MHVCVYAYTHIYIEIHMYNVEMYICMHSCDYACMRMYVCMYACMHMYMGMYMHMHI